jgi:thiol-disulfide isomerase/thioredoxin
MHNMNCTLRFHREAIARARVRATHRRFVIAVIAAALLGLAGTPHRAFAQEAGIEVGATAPHAAVYALDGKEMDLGQYVGDKPVVLEFWATWCRLCKALEPSLSAAREKYHGRVPFVSVGVPDNQSAARQKAFVEEKHIGGEFVLDRDSKAVKAYKVPHTSYVVVVAPSGKVVCTGVGAEQDISAAVSKAFEMHGGMNKEME